MIVDINCITLNFLPILNYNKQTYSQTDDYYYSPTSNPTYSPSTFASNVEPEHSTTLQTPRLRIRTDPTSAPSGSGDGGVAATKACIAGCNEDIVEDGSSDDIKKDLSKCYRDCYDTDYTRKIGEELDQQMKCTDKVCPLCVYNMPTAHHCLP